MKNHSLENCTERALQDAQFSTLFLQHQSSVGGGSNPFFLPPKKIVVYAQAGHFMNVMFAKEHDKTNKEKKLSYCFGTIGCSI